MEQPLVYHIKHLGSDAMNPLLVKKLMGSWPYLIEDNNGKIIVGIPNGKRFSFGNSHYK